MILCGVGRWDPIFAKSVCMHMIMYAHIYVFVAVCI